MSPNAPRSIEEYLKQLRAALAGEDSALIHDALYDAEEYLRAEVASSPGKSEADVLEIIASTYGAPEEVAAAYRDTEARVKAHLYPPRRATAVPSLIRRFFQVFLDPHAYLSVFYMLLALATGILYFIFVVVGVSVSAGLGVLVIGIPFFLAFIGLSRVISLGEGRLLEAITGQRMPRRPLHPGAPGSMWQRIGDMLKDPRTWTTLVYLVIMLPLGILYFVIAMTGLGVGLELAAMPVMVLADKIGWLSDSWGPRLVLGDWSVPASGTFVASLVVLALGVVILTLFMHVARAIASGHARLAKALLVEPGS